ncbi:MAG: hypothetical protein ACR2QU_08055 [Gammaproteobacteria bacterium]
MNATGSAVRSEGLVDVASWPKLTGALQGLKLLDLGDLPRYKQAVTAGQQIGWAYYFPSLMTFNRRGRSAILLGEDSGSICTYRWTSKEGRQKLEIMVAPAPMQTEVLRRCIERANDFNSNRSARVMRLDEKDRDSVSAVSGLNISEHKSQFLFSPGTYADLGGRKFRTIRRNVSRVEGLEGLEVQPFSAAYLEPCQELLKNWGRRHRELHGTRGGVGTSRRALSLTAELSGPDLFGEVVLLRGSLVAYAFGGEIRPGVGAFFDAKCEIEPPGLSFFHRYSFLSKQRQLEIVNDGSDVGREGLRQLKNSLRPVGSHMEYRATQRID